MLIGTKKEPTRSPITFVKEELNLVLTKRGKWQFLGDLKENEEPLQVETFSFGDSYGVIRYGEIEESYIKIRGITWYVVTDIKTSMPILKSREAQNQQYLELKPIEYKYSIF